MSDNNKYDFLKGNRTIFYIFLPIVFLIIEVYKNGWGDIDYLGYVVSTLVPLLVLEGLNWSAKKFSMCLDKRRNTKKSEMRKV